MTKIQAFILATGLSSSLLVSAWAWMFFSHQALIDPPPNSAPLQFFVQLAETLDSFSYDFKIRQWQDKQSPESSSAVLIAVDDQSLNQVGRWPWDRRVIARLLERVGQLGVKSVGMDVVFSEPQTNPWQEAIARHQPDLLRLLPQPDQELTKALTATRDRVVLGIFPEGFRYGSPPYQDYCRNEAFIRYQANQINKLENVSFLTLDESDTFDSLPWNELFSPIFDSIDQSLQREDRKTQGLEGYREYLAYCDRWLSSQDEYMELSSAFLNRELQVSPTTWAQSIPHFPLPQYDEWVTNIPELQEVSRFSASFAAEPDTDGKLRRQSLFFRTGNKIGSSFIPTLALQTYLTGHPELQARAIIIADPRRSQQKIVKSIEIWDLDSDQKLFDIPVSYRGQMFIPYYGPRWSVPYVPAHELLNDEPEMRIYFRDSQNRQELIYKTVNKSEFLKDKLVILGVTATAVYDLRVTPWDNNFPGPEIHTHILRSLEDKRFLRSWNIPSPIQGASLVFVLGSVVTLASLWLGPLGLLSLGLGTAAGITGASALSLQQSVMMPDVFFYVVVFASLGSILLVKYFGEEKKKLEIKKTFSKYVAPAVVEELLAHPENLSLGGRKQEVTIFFSDVRGFTTFSEKLDPGDLSEVLNSYLTPMTEIIFKHQGTIDKYMGDAIMAFWGAPIAFDDHAQKASLAALENLAMLKTIQAQFQARGWPQIDIGIGLNTATVSVGNMGSRMIQNYTVMGDGVNLASRLEGATKTYGVRILIGENTFQKLDPSFICRPIDRVRVKGKKLPVQVFELLGHKDLFPVTIKDLHLYTEALEHYGHKQFSEAKTRLLQFLEKNPEDGPAQLYLERVEQYLLTPPPEEWDGVFEMKTK
jgi:adenylate cyclase